MKKTLFVVIILIFSIAFGFAGNMKFISHQGTRVYAPENSLPGYEIAAKMGYYALNFAQVRASKDGTLFIMHDASVERTTDGKGDISDLTDSQIAKLRIDLVEDYAEYSIKDFTSDELRIPTLDEAIAICVKYNVVPLIRLGIEPKGNEKAFENLFALIDKYGIADNFILSGSVDTMNYLDKFFPSTMKVVYDKNADAYDMIRLFNKYTWTDKSTVYAMLQPKNLTKAYIKKIKDAGYGTYAANPGDMKNPEKAMKEFIRLDDEGCEFVNSERFPGIVN